MKRTFIIGVCLGVIILLIIYNSFRYLTRPSVKIGQFTEKWIQNYPDRPEINTLSTKNLSISDKILQGAKKCVRQKAVYTPGYFQITYPMGDLPQDKGVCTDVIIRSFRNAGIDLQKLIHLDIKEHFQDYPQLWGLSKPDTNIDHRRIPNLMYFFKKYGKTLSRKVNDTNLNQWQISDIVFWRLDNGLLHCGIISDTKNNQNIPYVIHNLDVTAEEDCLTDWEIIGHFRYLKD